MTIWFDVEDLIRFFQSAKRPTGIQRFSFESCAAAARLSQGLNHSKANNAGIDDVGFCRRSVSGMQLIRVDFTALEARIRAASDTQPKAPEAFAAQPFTPPPPLPFSHTRIFKWARSLPPAYRLPLGEIYRASINSGRALRRLWRAALISVNPPAPPPANSTSPAPPFFETSEQDKITLRPGDWLINLGASWERPYTESFINQLRNTGVYFGLFAHDMIPDLFPEWCTQSMVQDFSLWLDETVPCADRVFAISSHTLQDLQLCLNRRGRNIPATTKLPPGGHGKTLFPLQPRPLTEPYILMVGTIEARKNHGGMLRVWRHLINNPPAAGVPILVFAGKQGWLTEDLIQQLENASFLDGKILFIDQPGETQLAALYQHCLFTLYPSLYEGWGLPVTESLCFGKPAAASSSSAIPEAGGDYCCYFDPDNITDAYEIIRGWIEHPERPRDAAARIAAEFIPPHWADTAGALIAACTESALTMQGSFIPRLMAGD